MPNCFQLIRKSDPEAGAVSLQRIDEEMCLHFNEPCHPERWFRNWYNSIGMSLAFGRTFEELRKRPEEDGDWEPEDVQEWVSMIDWLDANFTTNAWYEHK